MPSALTTPHTDVKISVRKEFYQLFHDCLAFQNRSPRSELTLELVKFGPEEVNAYRGQ